MTTSNKQKPREFWLTDECDKQWTAILVNRSPSRGMDKYFIHVIEYSAFLELEQKLAKAVADLKYLSENLDDDGAYAIAALKALGESEVGEG